MKVLVATEKPFSKAAVDGIKKIIDGAKFETVLLEKYTDKAELLAAVKDVDAIIVRSDKVTKDVIDAAKNLKIVVRAGAGYDNVDLVAATEKGVVVMNTPGQNSNAVAELAIGMMIYMARNKFAPGTGKELRGKKLGIHAYGHVGRLVAICGKAMGMDVYAWMHHPNMETLKADGVKLITSVDELYSTCDYVSVHIPSNSETKKSLNYALLSKMPKGATIVNTARKDVIDEEGLVKVLTERPDMKYATDVPADNQAELNEKFAAQVHASTKKMGAETAEANMNAGLAAASQIVSFLVNGDRKFQVNK